MTATVERRFIPGLLDRIPSPAKVAVLRASRIGDFVCATPAFRALRARVPAAEITLIALPMVQSLAVRNTALDRFVAFPGWPGIAEQFYEPARTQAVLAQLRAERFDLAIQLHGSGVFANPFLLAMRARYSAGFVRPGDTGQGLDAALPMPAGNERDRLLALTRFLGIRGLASGLEFPLWAEDHHAAADLLRTVKPGPLIGLHAGARDATRRWPFACFLAAGQMLATARHGTIVLVGDAINEPVCDDNVLDVRGRTSLPVLGAIISRLAVLITNDSGPAHIAYALRVPSVTIFGATDPVQWGPPPGPHRIASHATNRRPRRITRSSTDNACLMSVSVESVCCAARSAMDEHPRNEHGTG